MDGVILQLEKMYKGVVRKSPPAALSPRQPMRCIETWGDFSRNLQLTSIATKKVTTTIERANTVAMILVGANIFFIWLTGPIKKQVLQNIKISINKKFEACNISANFKDWIVTFLNFYISTPQELQLCL